MVEIHWVILLLIVSVSSFAGFMLCAILTMGKMADQAMDTMRDATEKINSMNESLKR